MSARQVHQSNTQRSSSKGSSETTVQLSITPATRTVFFGESNLAMLLNVVSGVYGKDGSCFDTPFDRTNSQDRTLLFRSMSAAYQNYANKTPPLSLDQLNKIALRETHHQLSERSNHHTKDSYVKDVSIRLTDGGNTIRDLDTHRRPMPKLFPDRPEDTAVTTSGGDGGGVTSSIYTSTNEALARLEAQRSSDDPPKVVSVDFNDKALDNVSGTTLGTHDEEVDNRDVMKKMEALLQSRAHDNSVTGCTGSLEQMLENQTDKKHSPLGGRQEDVSNAMHAFEQQTSTLNARVASEEEAKQKNVETDRELFRKASTTAEISSSDSIIMVAASGKGKDEPAVVGMSLDASHIPPNVLYSDSESPQVLVSSFSGQPKAVNVADNVTLPSVSSKEIATTTTTTRFDDTVAIQTNLMQNASLDKCTFQQALQFDNHGDVDERMVVHGTDMRDKMIIRPRQKYVMRTHYLEVSSADRIRTVQSSETPHSFSVYFGSDEPGYRVVPVFDDHPIMDPCDTEDVDMISTNNGNDEDDDVCNTCTYNLCTTEIRDKLGIYGIPADNGTFQDIDVSAKPLEYKTLYNCATNSRANVDTVFHNIVALQTNHVQLYIPFHRLTTIPYILLEISQFASVYNSTNNTVRKSFCKLFYDRSTSPGSDSNIHVFVPLNHERKTFTTPLANMDRLTFRLYTPKGQLLTESCASETCNTDVFRVIDITTELHDSGHDLCITLAEMDCTMPIQAGDCIHFDGCIEWYNKDIWTDWWNNTGKHEHTAFQETNRWYCEQLHLNRGGSVEHLQKLREEFSNKQVRFSYPTQAPTPQLKALTAFLTRPSGLQVRRVDIANRRIYVEMTTEPNLANQLGVEFSELTLGANKLLYAYLHHTSNTTNISMTVWTREEEDVIMASNI